MSVMEHGDANMAAADEDAQMEAIEESILGMSKALNENEAPRRLTMQLIRQSMCMAIKHSAKRLLSTEDEEEQESGVPEAHSDDESQEIDALLKKKALRLDWMNLGRIENLDAFTHIQELYLQHNLIKRIEHLDDHNELTFLALGGNRIKTVENIKHLDQLKFLDLSNNCIDDFDIGEFPSSLVILRLAGNPFIRHMPAYVHLFFERLPNLIQVDQYRRAPAHLGEITGSPRANGAAPVAPVSFSPRSRYVELEMEVEMNQQTLTPRSAAVKPPEKPSGGPFDFSEYDHDKHERMSQWRQQLKELEARKAELEHDVPVITRMTSVAALRARRKTALERARASTNAAIADSISHFQQMELEHKEWQERQEQAA
ncbi:hypothetical protein Poli38472_001232 [Pythium oligandrum]|uniref:Uncharacterized protein n=1 Tax=Pythium oligandrum TaxID=41045 RepID=A0A8K1FN72_PYTOL|nr:hypothetical protein Poli38472_001232 [Pythium oligandrum]|eukprot:TMW69076.1 hypothetical protein Poli38472_001232 [Pythium oligandrum]